MAYTPVPTGAAGQVISASDWNTYIRDNFAAGVPDIFTTKGDLAVASGADAASRLGVGADGTVLTADSTQTLGVKWGALGITAAARYKVSATRTINNTTETIVNYDTSVFDTDSAVTTGASWKYTVPAGKGGYFLVAATALYQASTAWSEGERAYLALYKNTTLMMILGETFAQVAAATNYSLFVGGASVVSLADADYVTVKAYQNSGSNLTIDSDGLYSHIAIARLF